MDITMIEQELHLKCRLEKESGKTEENIYLAANRYADWVWANTEEKVQVVPDDLPEWKPKFSINFILP